MRPAVDEARAQLTLFLDTMEPLLPIEAAGAERLGTPDFPEPVSRPAVRERLDGLLSAFRTLEGEVRHVRETLDRDEGLVDGLEGRVLDLQSAERRLGGAVVALRTVLDPDEGEDRFVRWLEWRGRPRKGRKNLVMASAPIELGDLLREGLFEKLGHGGAFFGDAGHSRQLRLSTESYRTTSRRP